MPLFDISGKNLKPIETDRFRREKDIQTLIEDNLETIFDLQLISSEFRIGRFRIDTLAYDEQTNAFVIIEYKRGDSYSVIDQGHSYLNAMLDHKADPIVEYNGKLEFKKDPILKKNDIDWNSSRVIFVSPAFNLYQKSSISSESPFELWEIRKFENNLVVLEQLQPSSKESIKTGTDTNADSTEIRPKTMQEHVGDLNENLAEVWTIFEEKLKNLSDIFFYTTNTYVVYKRGNTVCCSLYFQKDQLKIKILRGNKRKSDEPPKGLFALDDPKALAEEKELKMGKSGRVRYEYNITLNKLEQLDYIMFLIKQKHESLA